ncbi:hypothetical protein ASPACDRAFT_42301 [Aspergillus aculeatus ATCC 16872]|uniref:NADH-cytochrome b5 reductase n=1 Tax=Aspergillus aculeatus (strain ATCC 16872 / CBS 172.66 / WB 5094) TaxID=690307 RepID=A0A1L9WXA2_ASPA1|nr:uncharacterized protein ASPACDRAFT_42301 [Aspergillus aculeatus ATCC 16872]OJK00811.1 hypothetical protein ASPACDRAFT_42301 [Aspergillus aculeatus ATCC 16872]
MRPSHKLIAIFTLASCGTYTFKRHLIGQALAETPGDEPPVMFSGFKPTSLRVQSVKSLSHDTKCLRFEYPNQTWTSGLQLTYQRGFLDLVVKKYPHGKVSSHLHSLKPGDSLYFLGPLPGYSWSATTASTHSQIYLIAGGLGITPAYQLARGILEGNPDGHTRLQVVFGANSVQDLVLKEDLDALQRRYPDRLQMHYLVSEAGPSTEEEGEKDVTYGARVTVGLLQQVFGGERQKTEKVLVCGPPPMEKALVGEKASGRGILEELGFEKDQIHIF